MRDGLAAAEIGPGAASGAVGAGSGSAGVSTTGVAGSAACAALVAAVRKGLTGRKATVSLPGGDLMIEWREADNHVLMTGPVELEHEGTFPPGLFAGAA